MASDVRLIRSPIAVAGMVLTTISAILFLIVFLADVLGLHTNPYAGILFFLLLPAVFLVGLFLIPFGAWVERRRRARGLAPSDVQWPRVDLNDPITRRAAVIVFGLTLANIVIVSLAAYRSVEYMDSPQFCGQTCHTVMKPEFSAYQGGPHSRVACVACHIGPGATSFARAKMSGIRQVLAVTFDTYSRPIPAPGHTLRPAREVCEQCHWPGKFHGDKTRRVTEYGDDEKNTASVTTLQIHVGGGGEALGAAQGIHWHMNIANTVEYIAIDDKRQVIPWVRVTDRTGAVREYLAPGVTTDQLAAGERRTMDCIDCHNRPAHTMSATAERAVDERIASGEIPSTLPFARRETVKALKASYPTQAAAEEGIARSLRDVYRGDEAGDRGARRQDVEKAVRAAIDIYRRSVFPEMHVQFGTYPNNIGHIDSPGCFRCHDDTHAARDGRKISQDCEVCHSIE